MTDKTGEPFADPDELRGKLARGEPVVIVDVRSAQEFLAGHVDGAVNATIVTVCIHGGQRPPPLRGAGLLRCTSSRCQRPSALTGGHP